MGRQNSPTAKNGSGLKKLFIFLTLLFAGLAALPLRAADTDVLTKNKVVDKPIQQTGVTEVSPDGKHMTVSNKGVIAKGEPMNFTIVRDKQ